MNKTDETVDNETDAFEMRSILVVLDHQRRAVFCDHSSNVQNNCHNKCGGTKGRVQCFTAASTAGVVSSKLV